VFVTFHVSFSGNGDALNLFYSTSPTINQLNSESLRIPILKSVELDDNRDGLTDRIEVNVQMPISKQEKILGASGLFYFDVQISSKARYIFDSMAFVNYESAAAIRNLYVDGDLIMRQTWPFSAQGGYETDRVLMHAHVLRI